MSPYSLYIDLTRGGNVSEIEPNDTLTQANAYSFGTVVTGSIPISTDLDYYTFPLAQNEKVVIQVDGDPDRNGTNLSRTNQFNPNFDLLAADGSLITAVDSDSQGGNGGLLSEALVYTNTSAISTTFAIRIKFDPSTPPEDDLGIYNLHMFKVGGGVCGPTGTPTNTAVVPTATRTNTAGAATSTNTTVAATATCVAQAAGWTLGAPFNATAVVRGTGVFFPANGNFYVMGGRTTDVAGSDLTNVHGYIPSTNTWFTDSDAPYPDNQVNNMVCGVLTVSGTPQIYCVGGSAAGATVATARVFSYNPATNSITSLPAADNWPGNSSGGNLPGGFAVFQNKLYILGGFTISPAAAMNTIYEFDPTLASGSRWTLKPTVLPVAMAYIPATTIGTLIYTGGGSTVSGGLLVDSTNSYVYNPVGNSISPITNIPRATGETRAVTVAGEMWVLGGGRTAPNPSNQVDIYNPGGGTWRVGLPFSSTRRNLAADSDGTRVWIAGGYTGAAPGTPVNTLDIYNSGVACATGTPTTVAATSTNTVGAATATPCAATSYTYTASAGATIVPGTVDIGNHGDDVITSVTLPFAYTVYDQSFTTVNVSSNGNLQFNSAITGLNDYINACLPVTDRAYSYTIYAFWDDQITAPAGKGVFSSVTGVAPNRIFNLEFRTCGFSTATTCAAGTDTNYEIRLYEGQTRFDLIYAVMGLTGSSATTGIQKNTTTYSQYSCNTAIPAGTMVSGVLGSCGTATATSTAGAATATPTGQVATATPTSCTGGPLVFNGAIAAGDPTQTNRLFRDDPQSTCAVPQTCAQSTGTFRYDTYTLTNSSASAVCVSITLDPQSCTGTSYIQSVAYLGTFNPANVCANYLGDIGVSPEVGAPRTYEVTVPAGATFVIVVNESFTDGCPAYTLTVSGLPSGGGCPSPTAVPPTPTSAASATPTVCPPTIPTKPHTVGLGGEKGIDKIVKQSKGAGKVVSSARGGTGASAPVSGTDVYWKTTAPISFILDDGAQEDSVGWTNQTVNYPAIWLNRFSPVDGDFPIQLNQISIQFPGPTSAGRSLVGLAINLLVYVDADRNNDPSNAVKIAQLPATVTASDGVTFSNYAVSVLASTPGDLYIGFSDTYNSGGVSPISFPSPLDTTASQVRSWVAGQSANIDPDYDNLGNNDTLGTIDSFGLPGNWVIRASGDTQAGGGCPTPTVVPTAPATVAPSSTPTTPPATVVPSATSTVGPTACPIQYVDVPPGSEFYPYIRCLACRKIANGYACGGPGEPCDPNNTGYFHPFHPITRGQIAKMVSNAAGFGEDPGPQIFEDVPPTHPFYQFINRLTMRGHMGGYPCGAPGEPCVPPGNRPYFRPGAYATRGQVSKIVANAAGITTPIPAGTQTYEDVPSSNPFWVYIERLTALGVMSGYPCGGVGEPCVPPGNRPYFRPFAQITRGQTSKIVANTFYPNCQTPVGVPTNR